MKSVTEGDLADGATGHQLSGFLEVATGPSPVFYARRPYQTRWDCMAGPAAVKVPSRVDGRPGGCSTEQTFAEPVGCRCLCRVDPLVQTRKCQDSLLTRMRTDTSMSLLTDIAARGSRIMKAERAAGNCESTPCASQPRKCFWLRTIKISIRGLQKRYWRQIMLSQRVLLIGAAIIMSGRVLSAQTGMGTVQGVVRDASSGVIVDAKVTIVHTATMGNYLTTTNEVGFFHFPPTQFGSYKITVSATGMQTWEGEFLLPVGQTVDIRPVLNVGATAAQVTIAGDAAPLVATSDAVISTNLERARIEQLPLNGRSIATLVLMSTPGLSSGQDGGVNPIVNGLRDSVEMYQDGAVIKSRDTGDFSGRLPGLDSVQETRVETSLSSAKYNRPASITLSTRSGTNKVHGNLFETARNSAIGVARRRQDYYTKAPHYVRNEFGGSVGGPVFLPKLYNGKNRTFFFTSLEFLRSVSAATMSTNLVTMAMRQGDFSGLIDSLGRTQVIYDPWTTGPAPTWQRMPFPNNQIPVNRESPIAKYLFGVTPAPTNNANPLLQSNYFGLALTVTHDYMSTSRIDHRLGDRDQLFGRVTVAKHVQTYPRAVPTTDNTTSMVYDFYFDQNAAGSWIHTFSPTFVSETLVTFSREHKFVGAVDVPGIPNLAQFLGMPNPLNNNPPFAATGGNFGMEYAPQPARLSFTDIFVIDENLTRTHGRHEIQFGGRFHQEYLHAITDQSTDNVSFNTNATGLFDPSSGSAYSAVPQTGYGTASMFLGAASSYSQGATQPGFYLRDPEYSAYVQDNWKVTSKLTLNLGLRYQNLPGMTTVGNLATTFDKKTDSIVLGRPLQDMYDHKILSPVAIASYQAIGMKFETPAQAGIPASLVNRTNWNFQPRIGFAYRIGQTQRPLVLRGGYGIYNSQIAMRLWSSLSFEGGSAPYSYGISNSLDNQALAGVIPGLDGLPNYSLRSVPLYVAGNNIQHILDDPKLVLITPGSRQITYKDPDQSPSMAQEWNLSLGREILPNIVATASYVGTHANHLPQRDNINATPNDFVWYTTTGLAKPTGTFASTAIRPYDKTTYGNITATMKTGYSNANSLQLQMQRRFSHGYGFQFYYVLTNAFTNSTLVANGGGPTIVPTSSYLPGAVPQDFDQLNRSLYYTRDAMVPRSQLRWNWVVELPFGRGKPLGRNAGRLLNALIGAWQIAGAGSYNSTYWSLPTNNWGPIGKVEKYGTKYPIQDCTSGTCIPGYLYWNGYISPPLINRTNAAGNCTGVCGVPSNYTPATVPLIPYGTTTVPANAPANTNMSTFWDTNTVWVKLKDGSVVRPSYDTNLHPWMNQNAQAGPWRFSLDASAFKSIRVTEAVGLKLNADFFSVLNNPGLILPGGNGILSTQNSANSARTLQLTLRLTW
jgi:hypothetical protein